MTIYILAQWRYNPETEADEICDIGLSTNTAPQPDDFSVIDTAETVDDAERKLRWYRSLQFGEGDS